MTDNVVDFKSHGNTRYNITAYPVHGGDPEEYIGMRDFAFLNQDMIGGGQTMFVITENMMLDDSESLNDIDATFVLPMMNYKTLQIRKVDAE